MGMDPPDGGRKRPTRRAVNGPQDVPVLPERKHPTRRSTVVLRDVSVHSRPAAPPYTSTRLLKFRSPSPWNSAQKPISTG
jgi:hypothetical protein